MSKASRRRKAALQPQVQASSTGPSTQMLMGLGLALLVVVVVVLVAGGGLGAPASGGAVPSTKATPAAALDTARIKTLEGQIAANPGNKAALYEMGNIYYDAGQFTESIPWYAKVLALDPNDTNARTDMATAYYYTGDTNRAIEEGRKVLAIDSTKVQTRLNMGIWLTSLNPPQTAEAIQHWQMVINLYPGTDSAKQAQTLIDRYK